jgi:hypothetical protein
MSIKSLDLRLVTLERHAKRELCGITFVQPTLSPKNDNTGPRETSYAKQHNFYHHILSYIMR